MQSSDRSFRRRQRVIAISAPSSAPHWRIHWRIARERDGLALILGSFQLLFLVSFGATGVEEDTDVAVDEVSLHVGGEAVVEHRLALLSAI